MADRWTMCYGIVKGKMPKSAWVVNAKDYEGAIRSLKRSAQSNQRDMFFQATLPAEPISSIPARDTTLTIS